MKKEKNLRPGDEKVFLLEGARGHGVPRDWVPKSKNMLTENQQLIFITSTQQEGLSWWDQQTVDYIPVENGVFPDVPTKNGSPTILELICSFREPTKYNVSFSARPLVMIWKLAKTNS